MTAAPHNMKPGTIMIVGTAGDPRVVGYQAALARAGLPTAPLLDYRDLIADPAGNAARIRGTGGVRIESPGRDPHVLAGLLALGAAESRRRDEYFLNTASIPLHIAEHGRLLPPRQLFRGMDVLLQALSDEANACGARLTPDAQSIRLAFDKTACHELLSHHGLPVPFLLPRIRSFDALQANMRETGQSRVFVKLQHGSAAAGTVALAISKFGMRAISTVEMVTDDREGAVRLYNTRNIRHYDSLTDIARLINALAPYGLHVEAWIPKASIDGRVADMRVLTIAGEPVFRILRTSQHPITNLHLGGERRAGDVLLSRMSPTAGLAIDATVRRIAKLFPGALQLGIDIAVSTGFKRHYVLEVNAFGDLLKGMTIGGRDPYDIQVQAMERAA
jgi:glutathione synthase/RimK-type ligase-like ATP-grasp enzyme